MYSPPRNLVELSSPHHEAARLHKVGAGGQVFPTRVVLHELQARPELNGKKGFPMSSHGSTCRYQVSLDTGQLIWAREANIAVEADMTKATDELTALRFARRRDRCWRRARLLRCWQRALLVQDCQALLLMSLHDPTLAI